MQSTFDQTGDTFRSWWVQKWLSELLPQQEFWEKTWKIIYKKVDSFPPQVGFEPGTSCIGFLNANHYTSSQAYRRVIKLGNKRPVRFVLRRSILWMGLQWRFLVIKIYRYKCYWPNETNFLDFWQKLLILEQYYENKRIHYFHMG